MKNKKLTFMVGIPTCYGGESLINTVKTLRASESVSSFRIVIIADRTPIKKSIKDKLNKNTTNKILKLVFITAHLFASNNNYVFTVSQINFHIINCTSSSSLMPNC